MKAVIDRTAIAERLLTLRLAKGKTVAEMSDETGIGQNAIRNYEGGWRIPRDEVKIKLAHYFNKSVTSIFYS